MSKRELAFIGISKDDMMNPKWGRPTVASTLPPVWSWMPHSPKHRADLIARVECELRKANITGAEQSQLYNMREALMGRQVLLNGEMRCYP